MYWKTEIAVVNVSPTRQGIKKIYDDNPNDYTCVKDDWFIYVVVLMSCFNTDSIRELWDTY